MMIRSAALAALALGLASPALAQTTANPAPGCTATAQQLQAEKTLGAAFFRPGITTDERLALLDPKDYIQHNPIYLKYAKDHGTDEHETFRQLQSRPRPPPAPDQPKGDPLEVVTAECDLVTIVHRVYRPDPTAPGQWFAAFTFDTFRVRGGKFVEHWDDQTITAPPPGTPPGAMPPR